MKYRNNNVSSLKNTFDSKILLEIAVHLLELGVFNPITFCHEQMWFQKDRYVKIMLCFLNLLRFFDTCGISVEIKIVKISDIEKSLYNKIIDDMDYCENIIYYDLIKADFYNLNVSHSKVPEGYAENDFALVKLYLLLRTGTALNRKALEGVIGKKLSDSEASSIRKQFELASCHRLIKRRDNSYEMG